ncbi:succinate dehydrogenase subunit C [Hasllibacter halocynthiae]|uniref:Succinate dehydrogenase cytochrome b556 subunit n=1 Tax=Hasllibacter halocynthiae TaxID=595589 RepID=A0A2T0X190_9RHOB|nr:succinate dehydrogenase, cytochrome b556 subunit [Hasllibacter halocynthiae]PRY92687.1 succinate dehydrogenase subunit C [Hasllibacter halocynthiae]
MADVNRGARPLSPHIMIYKPQITSISSIFIRITGQALIVATLMIVWWFVALATGPEAFAIATWWLTMPLGDLVLGLSVWALWYHLLGGLRHLYWDAGGSMEIEWAERLGWACFIGATVLTLLTWLVFLFV